MVMADTSIPQSRNDIISFYAQHAPIWSTAPVDIGLTIPTAAAVKAAADEAVAALNAAEAARNASKVATDTLNAKAASLRLIGGAAMATIRAFAETTGNEEIYQKAQISPPAPPKPVGPPVSPTEFSADPNADGTITLKWKGTVSGNQWFVIERSIDMGAWTFIKSIREKRWLDTAVPMNVSNITYRVFGLRGSELSVSPPTAAVNFGTLPAALAAAFRTPNSQAA